jgi:archaeal preflagellin peptidase FlaK
MLEHGMILDIIRLFTGAIILFYASYTDIKTRRASNILWVIMASIGGVVLLIEYIVVGFENIFYLLFIPIMIVLMYVLFQLRLIFGGADAKALMALAILIPIQPHILQFPLLEGTILSMPGSWIVFSNSILLFLCIPLSLLLFNIVKRNVKFPHCVLGYKMSVQKAKKTFVWPLERIKDGKPKFSYMPKEFDTTKEYEAFENQGIKTIWVTPKIPFMIPLLAGFLATFIFGDLLSELLKFFM